METTPLHQQTQKATQSQAKGRGAADLAHMGKGQQAFEEVLHRSARTITAGAVSAAEETRKQQLARDKSKVEKKRLQESEEEGEENLEKTVKNLKKAIKALAELERRGLGI